jgi:exonuclease SbcD
MRLVLTADTHLGFDHPLHPRKERRRRGPDFLANFLAVVEHARTTRAHALLHAGDLFDTADPPPAVVDQAYAAMLRLAEEGTFVALVAGNHERAALPLSLLLAHPRIHVFHRPGSFRVSTSAGTLAVHGQPYVRGDLHGAGWLPPARQADVEVSLLHQAVEGAVVGPQDFTFRAGPSVLGLPELPADVDVVACGHIHRHQVLWRHAGQRRIPVVYPGSVERTSVAEAPEPKGFVELDLDGAKRVLRRVPLAARVMGGVTVDARDQHGAERELAAAVARLPADGVLHVRGSAVRAGLLSAAVVNAVVPPGISVFVAGAAARAH